MSTRAPRAVALALLAVWSLAVPSFGDEEGGETLDLQALREERAEATKTYGVHTRTAKRLVAVVALLEAEQYAEARVKLEQQNFKYMNPYERAVAYRLLAFAAFGSEDLEGTVGYFEKVLEQEALPIDDEANVRFNVAQLQAALGRWEEVTRTLQLWFRYVEEPNPLGYYMLAIAYYQLDDHDRALEPAKKAVEFSPEPREAWLQLVAALYIEKEDYANATRVLEELVTNFPKKQYWVQLSLIYNARGNYENSLAVQQFAYALGLLTEDQELRRLARSYLYHQLPYPAAQVLEKGLTDRAIDAGVDALELLGNCWIAAREYDRSLEPLRRAAVLSEDGKLYMRLGRVHIQREQWKEAADFLRLALKKGGLEKPGDAQLLLGISLYSDERHVAAHSWFVRARRHESTRAQAKAWLEHLARESQAG